MSWALNAEACVEHFVGVLLFSNSPISMEHEVKFQFEVIETFIEIRHVTMEGA
jgi:hypothetical protein